MKIRDIILTWESLPGSAAGMKCSMDRTLIDKTTDLIKNVKDKVDGKGQKFIELTVQLDKNIAFIYIRFEDVIPSKQHVYEKVVKGLKLAIGKTLNEAGEIII